ncbi:K(+)-transporting ATPase subunit C [Aliarcobacter cryaerophilus]|uniref:K(+)-transporting ATPase subunit C n=2 Tax=Aliarcobacter cryaerophilus TaxID=28198 RepID=UPI000825968A|nr:K(+)-transporting ATPase subunit C [Aliarcobacter cryaerophilus]
MYNFFKSLKLLSLMTILLGFIYPLIVLGIGNLIFPFNSKGSLIEEDNKIVGSIHLGQNFTKTGYFISRPSNSNYDSMASGGTNLAQTNPKLIENIDNRRDDIFARFKDNNIPIDLLTTSSSGLDPHISKNSAIFQIKTIAKERNLDIKSIEKIVEKHIEKRYLGIIGEERVNVLLLNIALDKEFGKL